jgi:hypothetical protein
LESRGRGLRGKENFTTFHQVEERKYSIVIAINGFIVEWGSIH